MNSEKFFLSVVLPVYNEEENIQELTVRVADVMKGLGRSFEIIFVDDMSSDKSLELMLDLKEKYPIRIIRLKRRTGQSGALAAGFFAAEGEFTALLDADLQCVPDDIPLLLDKFEDGVDAVCGIRRKRNDSLIKKISSKIGNGFRNVITGEKISDTNCPLKIFRTEALREIVYFRGFHRFIPTLLKMNNYTVIFEKVNHYPRLRGKSKYNISNRVFTGFGDVLGVRWMKKRFLEIRDAEEM